MASERTLNALQKLATVGLGAASSAAYDAYKDEQDTVKFNKALNRMLPEAANLTNTKPEKMEAAYKVGMSSSVTNNIDHNLRYAKDTAPDYASMSPDQYNSQLAQQLLPTVRQIESLSGAEKSVAQRRMTKEITAIQSKHMESNKKYIQTLTRNSGYNTINSLMESSTNDNSNRTPAQKAALFDEDLTLQLGVLREKGLPDLDAQRLFEDVAIGKIERGDLKFAEVLANSKYYNFIAPEKLMAARYKAEKSIIENTGYIGNLSQKKQRQVMDKALDEHIKSGGTISTYVSKNIDKVSALSPKVFADLFLPKAGNISFNNRSSNDSDVIASREQTTAAIAALIDANVNPEIIINKLGKHRYLEPVVKAMYAGTDPSSAWREYDYKQQVETTRQASETEAQFQDRINSNMDNILERMDERASVGFFGGVANFLGFDDDIDPTGTSDLKQQISEPSFKTDVTIKASLYQKRMGKTIDWEDEDEVDKFMSTMYNVQQIGDKMYITDKTKGSFTDGLRGANEVNTEFYQIAEDFKQQFLEKYNPEDKGRYNPAAKSAMDNMTYVNSAMTADTVSYRMSPNGDRVFINLHKRDPGLLGSEKKQQAVRGMYRVVDKPYGGNANRPTTEFELLDAETYNRVFDPANANDPEVQKELAKLHAQGYRQTTTNGAIELSPEQFKKLYEGRRARQRYYNMDSTSQTFFRKTIGSVARVITGEAADETTTAPYGLITTNTTI